MFQSIGFYFNASELLREVQRLPSVGAFDAGRSALGLRLPG